MKKITLFIVSILCIAIVSNIFLLNEKYVHRYDLDYIFLHCKKIRDHRAHYSEFEIIIDHIFFGYGYIIDPPRELQSIGAVSAMRSSFTKYTCIAKLGCMIAPRLGGECGLGE